MDAPRWWSLVIVFAATAHCLALANPEDSDLLNPGPQESPPRPALPCHKISVGNIDFAFSLYRQLALRDPRANILFSPVSVSSALAMLLRDAPAASRTQLLEGLGFNLSVVPEAEIQEGFQDLLFRLPGRDPQLLVTLDQHRVVGPRAGPFRTHLDEYTEKQTPGTLGAWVEDLGSETEAVFMNRMLLRAGWAKAFDPSATSPKDFFVSKSRAVQVPMMKQKAGHRLLHDPELQCTVLQLGHAGNATTFFIFPHRGKLTQLEDALLPETLIKWDSLLRTRELDFYFPKFSISSTYTLEEHLPRVAVGFPGHPALHIFKVTHKATMTLDEAGLEAAAATSIQLAPRSQPHLDPTPPPDTESHRPFLVMTFHMETGSMLLLGRVVNPLG